MYYWNTICVEGYCSGGQDEKELFPCGNKYPTSFCLKNNMCPLFMYVETTERDTAYFVPLRYILLDRLKQMLETLKEALLGVFKNYEYLSDNIKFHTAEEIDPNIKRLIDEENLREEKLRQDFKPWFDKVLKEKDALD
jgi:hypothetical protein